MSFKDHCTAYRTFSDSLTNHLKDFSSRFMELHAKLDAVIEKLNSDEADLQILII
jgi:hypothetical protein